MYKKKVYLKKNYKNFNEKKIINEKKNYLRKKKCSYEKML